jgi:hypothetical protein
MTSYKDWIYDVLKNYSTSTKKEPFFVSSWDCDPEMVMYPLNIISDLHHNDFHEFRRFVLDQRNIEKNL